MTKPIPLHPTPDEATAVALRFIKAAIEAGADPKDLVEAAIEAITKAQKSQHSQPDEAQNDQ